MNLLVTGGAGFIGSNFIRQRLLEKGPPLTRIVNLDALTYAGNPANLADVAHDPRYVFVHGDIGDTALVAQLLGEHQIDAVIHFAAESHVDRSIDSPEPFFQTNVIGTLRLLNCAKQHWSGLPGARKGAFRFLHVSTDEVFGTLAASDPPFCETNQYLPNSPYAASKAASDHLVRGHHHTYGLPVLTTNCSNNYGPWQFPEKLIPLIIANALAGKPLPIYGDGMQVRDWLYVGDHCSAIRRVLEAGRLGEVYCIGGSSEKPNIEVVKTLCGILDRERPRADGTSYATQITYVKDRPGHDRRYAIDARKISTELGWKPAETFETGMRKTVRWYLDHQDWVADVTSGGYRDWVAKHYG
jgi:dTDP-glucose 4,6-dehydratase